MQPLPSICPKPAIDLALAASLDSRHLLLSDAQGHRALQELQMNSLEIWHQASPSHPQAARGSSPTGHSPKLESSPSSLPYRIMLSPSSPSDCG